VSPTARANKSLASRSTPLFPWIVSLWLLVITGWYVVVAVRSLRASHLRGELWWACLLAGFAVTVVV
jgi:hypothetical protein